ncbi:extracellular solute-binding protein [Paenibacillus hunanensis]|uniref:Aldouronate transport system substrate-binding protein n=1 Tax=Paenibacillus hunanensis TaxID=539262 RepID=A0ABU1J600_9BACL|nr:extracellular solute-binding protein [Paenibacillus hunanensis]MDR6246631.1 putative aldouronate transport system substrate-binding protein [Paenibacillus hunanensis]GGJ00549.1 sugar ABC transporter substrate-binding protein [Paenibacillus hunanensis]
MKKERQIAMKRLAAVMVSSAIALTACGGQGASSGEYDANSKATITWLNILHTASPPTDTILNKLEEKTNSDITFSWIPDASKEERINTALASDSLADIVTLTMLDNSSVRNSLKSGLFWEVEPYLKDYPNLAKISPDTIKSASIGGKLYGIPFQKDLARNGVTLRKDWLDKLGLEVPKTTDELMEVARAFTEDDPDGNGQDDTTGFVDRNDLVYGAFKTLGSYFGTPNNWQVSADGKMTPEFMTDGYLKTMNYMKQLYDKGYMNKDFAVTAKTDQQQKFAQGKAGIYVGALFDSKNLLNMSKGVQDNMQLVMANDITSTGKESDRAIWAANNGIGGLLAFPRTEVKDEAQLKRILQFVNDLLDEDSYALMTYGIEGTHYKLDDKDAATIINTDLWQQEVQPFAASRPKESGFKIHDADPLKQQADKMIADNANYAVLNPAYSLDSETYNTQGSELQKIITDATYKYILGEIDEAGFKEALETWKSSGGNSIIAEYEAAYKQAQGQ